MKTLPNNILLLSFICITLLLLVFTKRSETTRRGLKNHQNDQRWRNEHSHSSTSNRRENYGGKIKHEKNMMRGPASSSTSNRRENYEGKNKHEKKLMRGPASSVDTDNLLVGCQFSRNPREYRTIDGTFNNAKNPIQGASETPFFQMFPPLYDDGVNVPRGTDPSRLYNGFPLPLVRQVTLDFRADSFENDSKLTDIHVHFSQLFIVDLQNSQFIPCPELAAFCGTVCEYTEPCFAALVPDDDPFFDNQKNCIINVSTSSVRVASVCGTGKVTPKKSRNLATSYLDGSSIYGSTVETGIRLRDPNNIAYLRSGTTEYATSTGKPLLPLTSDDGLGGVSFCLPPPERQCFASGLRPFNGSPQLVAQVTLFSREHNRLAKKLEEFNHSWGPEKVYQEARKIVIATLQHIAFTEYMPTVFSDIDEGLGKYQGYNPKIDSSVFEGFSGVTRFHHMLKPVVERVGPNYVPMSDVPIGDTFFTSVQFILENGLDVLLRADVSLPARKPSPLSLNLDELITPPFPDIMTGDLLRGRDRGWQTYNTWRKYCGLPSCDNESFDCYSQEIKDKSVRDKLENLYGSTNNVELGIGGIAENPIGDEIIGPTIKCIFIEQLRRARDGDSYWYERKGMFSAEQLAEIKKTSLARIICDNGDAIKTVPENVFKLSDPDTFISCDSVKEINLEKWKALDTCTLT